jgi:predicted nucleotidyltransferase
MARAQNPNLEILELAVEQLGELADQMVFLGGCATGLLMTDAAAPPIRVTRDVDAIVQVASLAEYHQLADKLRERGFREDTSDDAPLCRWTTNMVILDVMPTDSSILGFANRWYDSAIEHAEWIQLPSGRSIRMVSSAYFLITKLEAFDGRGQGDYLMSHDIEDIVAVLDGRPELVDEVKGASPELANELAGRFKGLLQEGRFVDSVSGHMPGDSASQDRVSLILSKIEEIANIV